MFSNIKLFLYNNDIVLKKKIEYQKQEKNAADLFRRPWCLYDLIILYKLWFDYNKLGLLEKCVRVARELLSC